MEIKHDESYLYLYEDIKQTGFTNKIIGKIAFQAYRTDINGKYSIQKTKDFLENNFKMYQYKKDNGVKFGEEDLFYWSNGEELYFDVSLNEKNSLEYNQNIVDKIISYVEQELNNVQGCVRLQYAERTDWNKINEYINDTTFNIDSLPFKTLIPIINKSYGSGNTLSLDNRNKIIQIEKEIFEKYQNKKITVEILSSGIFGNSITEVKGTLKFITSKNEYGIFKPRSRKTYYPISLSNIYDLKVC